MEANSGGLHTLLQCFILLNFIFNVSGRKADEMCKKYGQLVYSDEPSPVLLPGAGSKLSAQCSIVEVPLIVGGIKATASEFPHMVTLGYGGGDGGAGAKWMCGGALISDRYVLTAAHCLKSRQLREEVKWARVGGGHLEAAAGGGGAQVLAVEATVAHPGYEPPSSYHDVALILLKGDVQLGGDGARPACLNTHADLWTRTAIATGYGRLGYDTEETSKYLLKVTLHLVPNDKCNETYKFDVKGKKLPDGIRAEQMCAGEKDGGKDTCQGDSGGPLQTVLEEPYCMYTLLGITSFGKFCGMPNSPAVYTRVSHYLDWIESVVWP